MYFFTFALIDPTYKIDISGKMRDGTKVEIHEQKPNTTYSMPINREENLLFVYNDIKVNFISIFKEWIRLSEDLKYLMEPYFILLYNQDQSIQNKFLNLIQIFEGLFRKYFFSLGLERPVEEFDQRKKVILESIKDSKIRNWLKDKLKYSNEISLEFRLKRIVQYFEFLESILGQDIDNFCTDTAKIRNFLTHFDIKNEENYSMVNILYYTNILKMIVDVILLQKIGFSKDQIVKILREKDGYKNMKYEAF